MDSASSATVTWAPKWHHVLDANTGSGWPRGVWILSRPAPLVDHLAACAERKPRPKRSRSLSGPLEWSGRLWEGQSCISAPVLEMAMRDDQLSSMRSLAGTVRGSNKLTRGSKPMVERQSSENTCCSLETRSSPQKRRAFELSNRRQGQCLRSSVAMHVIFDSRDLSNLTLSQHFLCCHLGCVFGLVRRAKVRQSGEPRKSSVKAFTCSAGIFVFVVGSFVEFVRVENDSQRVNKVVEGQIANYQTSPDGKRVSRREWRSLRRLMSTQGRFIAARRPLACRPSPA